MEIEDMSCSICHQGFDEQDHLPVLLPDCGHSFCLECIKNGVVISE